MASVRPSAANAIAVPVCVRAKVSFGLRLAKSIIGCPCLAAPPVSTAKTNDDGLAVGRKNGARSVLSNIAVLTGWLRPIGCVV